jgi:hypothetical protein
MWLADRTNTHRMYIEGRANIPASPASAAMMGYVKEVVGYQDS